MSDGHSAPRHRRSTAVAGTRRHPYTSSNTRKAVLGGVGAIASAVLIAWLTPVGPWLWGKVFPPPKVNVSVSFLREGCGSYVVANPSGTSPADPDIGSPDWLARHRAASADATLPGRGTSRI